MYSIYTEILVQVVCYYKQIWQPRHQSEILFAATVTIGFPLIKRDGHMRKQANTHAHDSRKETHTNKQAHTHTHTGWGCAVISHCTHTLIHCKNTFMWGNDVIRSDWTAPDTRPHNAGKLLCLPRKWRRQRVVTFHLPVYWGIMTFINASDTVPTAQQTYVGYLLCCIMGRISELFDSWSSSWENLAGETKENQQYLYK